MIVLYYSPGALFPALLAAMNHAHPDLPPERAWLRARERLDRHGPAGERPVLLEEFGPSPGGETLYLAAAPVPSALLRRTLSGLGVALTGGRGTPPVLLAGPLPPWRGRWTISAPGRAGYWEEIRALVERTRLQIELIGRP